MGDMIGYDLIKVEKKHFEIRWFIFFFLKIKSCPHNFWTLNWNYALLRIKITPSVYWVIFLRVNPPHLKTFANKGVSSWNFQEVLFRPKETIFEKHFFLICSRKIFFFEITTLFWATIKYKWCYFLSIFQKLKNSL